MRSKASALLILAAFLFAASGPLLAKSLTLDAFWKEIKARHYDDDYQSKECQRFIRDCALDWKPAIIPLMISDAQLAPPNEGEVRDIIYTVAVLYIPDREGCKAMLAKIRASPHAKDNIGTDSAEAIAEDFQRAIDDVETGQEKLPSLD